MSFGEPKLISAAPAFRKSLLLWFFKNHRPLPWRKKISAYRTVVSELMCQQTQIATVIPYFEKWVKKWPDFATLAKAKESAKQMPKDSTDQISRVRSSKPLRSGISST